MKNKRTAKTCTKTINPAFTEISRSAKITKTERFTKNKKINLMTKAHKITKIKMKAYVLIFHLIQNIKYYNSMLINRKKTLVFRENIFSAFNFDWWCVF